jgi:hypothetical protein
MLQMLPEAPPSTLRQAQGEGLRKAIVSFRSLGRLTRLPIMLIAFPSATSAHAQTIDDLSTVGPYLQSCLSRQPQPAGDIKREATLRFSFRRDGALIGEPFVTRSEPKREAPGQAEFIAGRIAALKACAPLPLSAELGGAIAGRPYTFRFIAQPRKKETPI